MATGRPLPPLELALEERASLEWLVRRGKTAQQWAFRARIVLRCAEGLSNTAVARALGTSINTVGKWRSRFVQWRLDGLGDEPRPGAPRTVSDEQVEEVVTLTLESPPKGATHWSTRSMAKRVAVSQSTVNAERLAVVPLHAAAQAEGELLAAVAPEPALGEIRHNGVRPVEGLGPVVLHDVPGCPSHLR
jgi:transposase